MKFERSRICREDRLTKLVNAGQGAVIGYLVREDADHYEFFSLAHLTRQEDTETRQIALLVSPWLGTGVWTLLKKDQIIGLTMPTESEALRWREWIGDDNTYKDLLLADATAAEEDAALVNTSEKTRRLGDGKVKDAFAGRRGYINDPVVPQDD